MKHMIIIALICMVGAPTSASAAPVAQQNPLFPVKATGKATALQSMSAVGLFTYTFTLTATGEDVFVPTSATRSEKDMRAGVLYDITESDANARAGGASGAFLYSKASSTKGMYFIPKGQTREFTLVAAHNNRGGEHDHYRMRLTGIRYALREATNVLTTETNGFSKYKTREVELMK
ncbi:MAG: hypothetical protein RLZZ234_813 [Candidatus Parcubacteria bacterium]|jgi:hypothetical protein